MSKSNIKKDDIISDMFDLSAILESYSCNDTDTETSTGVMIYIGKRIKQLALILSGEDVSK